MTTPTSPQKLGRYEILEEIGKGAMGVVYLARDPLIGRQVALKTFRVGFSAKDQELQQFRSRFVREAQSAGILSHPNIVTIHDVVDEGADGVCFIAMEYVKGTNLKQLLQKPDPFSPDFVVDIVSQIAEGLDYAHSRGVVHRDIKPANILITQDGKVKITDFGIARLDTSNLTMEGQLLGTPNYMAPEQIQGRDVDHRADIFSLGVVLYEMVTRRKPFQGENLTAVTHKIVYEAFTPPEEIVRDLAPGISAVLYRCLEKDPNRRYPRAAEIAGELKRSVEKPFDGDDTSATQEVVEDTVDRTVPQSPVPVALVAMAMPAPPVVSPPAVAVAVAPPPPASLSGPTQVGAALTKIRKQRTIQLGLAILAGLTVLGLVVLWALGGDTGPSAVAPPSALELQHANALRALAEARSLLDQGSLQGALKAIARAESAEPGNPEAQALRDEVDRISRDVAAAAEREQLVSESLVQAREAFAKRRYEEAITAANQILASVPDHPEAVKLLHDSESALERQKERTKAQRPPSAVTPEQPAATAPQPTLAAKVAPAPPQEVSGEAQLAIDFYSELSEGVLTIYAGEKQILREPFKFVRRTGFLRSEKLSGSLEASRTLPAGAHTLRVYVTLPGKPTKVSVVEARLAGGSKRELEIRVDGEGRTAAELN